MSQKEKSNFPNYTTSKSPVTRKLASTSKSLATSTSKSPATSTSKSASTSKSPATSATSTSKSASTCTPATSSTSTKSSRIDTFRKRYENVRVPESDLGQESNLEQEEAVPQNQDFAQADLYDYTALAAGMIFYWLLLYGKFAFFLLFPNLMFILIKYYRE